LDKKKWENTFFLEKKENYLLQYYLFKRSKEKIYIFWKKKEEKRKFGIKKYKFITLL